EKMIIADQVKAGLRRADRLLHQRERICAADLLRIDREIDTAGIPVAREWPFQADRYRADAIEHFLNSYRPPVEIGIKKSAGKGRMQPRSPRLAEPPRNL